jgi:MFS family permease
VRRRARTVGDKPEPARRAGEVAFWLIGYVFAALILGTALPAPLYAIYQRQWHFSSGVLTLIFAVYAVAVLATLLLAGRASDQAGVRR